MRAAGIAFRFHAGLALMVLALCAEDASAVTRFVNAGLATGANDGSSWANAYQGPLGLVNAIAAAGAGDQVWTAAGAYKATTTPTRTIHFTLKNGVEIYGGFAGNEATLAQRNFTLNVTTLSADLLSNDGAPGTFINDGDNSFHVVDAAFTNSTAVLDGFTVTGGNSNGSSAANMDRGGGILMLGGATSTIRNCIFAFNRCTFGGGAGYINSSSPSFTDCTFLGNQGGAFGGAFDQANGVNTQFTRCQFISNIAGRAGAVEAFGSSAPVFTNCLFRGNTATGANGGGALWVGNNSNVTLRLCTIVGNNASVNFAGIQNTGMLVTISNSIIYGNTGPGGSQAVAQQINTAAGTTTVTYSDVQGGFAGTGNINVNPLFVNQASGDLHLASSSPCIDAGNNSAVIAGTLIDLDGLPRFEDSTQVPDSGAGTAPIVDMGAYEWRPACLGNIVASSIPQAVNVDDLLAVIGGWGPCLPPPQVCPANIVNVGPGAPTVNVDDLLVVIANWGPCR